MASNTTENFLETAPSNDIRAGNNAEAAEKGSAELNTHDSISDFALSDLLVGSLDKTEPQTSVPDQVFMQPPPALIVSPTVQAASLIFKSRLLFAASEQRVALDLAKVAQELGVQPQSGIERSVLQKCKTSSPEKSIWDLPLSEKAKQEQLQLWLKVEGNTELAQVNVHQGGEMIVTGAATPDAVQIAVNVVVDTLQKVTAPGGEVPAYRSTFPELEYAKYVGQARVANTLWNLESIVWFVDARREETAWIGCRHVIENRICFSGVTIKDRKDTSPSKSIDCWIDSLGNVEVCGMLDYGMAKIVFNQTCSLLGKIMRDFDSNPNSKTRRSPFLAVPAEEEKVMRVVPTETPAASTERQKRKPKANTRFADEQYKTTFSSTRPRRKSTAQSSEDFSGVDLLLAAAEIDDEKKEAQSARRKSASSSAKSSGEFVYFEDEDATADEADGTSTKKRGRSAKVPVEGESRRNLPFGHSPAVVPKSKPKRAKKMVGDGGGEGDAQAKAKQKESRSTKGGGAGKFDKGRFIEFVKDAASNEFACQRCLSKYGVTVKMTCKRVWRDPVTKEAVLQRWGGCANKHDPKGNHMMTICYACEAAFIDHFKCPHYPDAWRSRYSTDPLNALMPQWEPWEKLSIPVPEVEMSPIVDHPLILEFSRASSTLLDSSTTSYPPPPELSYSNQS